MDCLVQEPARQAHPSPVRPFASLPHDIAADPRLTPTDLAVLLALLYWCRSRSSCWPSDGSIGARIGRSPATVQRRLRALESLGYVRRERCDRNPTGRVLVLTWRDASPVTDPPAAPVTDKENRVVQRERIQKGESRGTTRQRPPAAPRTAPDAPPVISSAPIAEAPRIASEAPRATVPAPLPARTVGKRPRPVLDLDELARLAPSDPILAAELARRTAPRCEAPPPPTGVRELCRRLRESPAYPAMLAGELVRIFNDPGSYSGLLAAVNRAWRGEIALGALEDAIRQGMNPSARRGGAVFLHALKRAGR